jgi:hypothetical protein
MRWDAAQRRSRFGLRLGIPYASARSRSSAVRLICGRSPSQAHDVRCAEPRGLGVKVSDEFLPTKQEAGLRLTYDG